MRGLVLVCLLVAGCASSTPTVEEVNASRAKLNADCQAKGYKPGTQDFQTCLALAEDARIRGAIQNQTAVGMGSAAAVVGLTALTALSDLRVKTDFEQLTTLKNGINLYRFRYLGSDQLYVGVIAQEVQRVMPEAVVQGTDGLLRVRYDLVGAPFTTWKKWSAEHTSGF